MTGGSLESRLCARQLFLHGSYAMRFRPEVTLKASCLGKEGTREAAPHCSALTFLLRLQKSEAAAPGSERLGRFRW